MYFSKVLLYSGKLRNMGYTTYILKWYLIDRLMLTVDAHHGTWRHTPCIVPVETDVSDICLISHPWLYTLHTMQWHTKYWANVEMVLNFSLVESTNCWLILDTWVWEILKIELLYFHNRLLEGVVVVITHIKVTSWLLSYIIRWIVIYNVYQ